MTETSSSVVRMLYRSGRYQGMKFVGYQSDVADLVREIEHLASVRGMILGRWETSSRFCGWIKTITYALYRGERPARSVDAQGPSIALSQTEGTTPCCEAYRRLTMLRNEIREDGK